MADSRATQAASYAKEHGLAGLLHDLVLDVLLHQPEDPVTYMASALLAKRAEQGGEVEVGAVEAGEDEDEAAAAHADAPAGEDDAPAGDDDAPLADEEEVPAAVEEGGAADDDEGEPLAE